ncbi:MAG TPA: hypothetical protein VN455_00595 [Methanotrichaceae archaeon]|nr:hypothetical protein [Methanotrichaceae archaeon]
MRSMLIPLTLVLAVLGCGLAASQIQAVGGDFGKSWIGMNSNKFPTSDTQNSLWNWGGSPKGYERVGSTIQPVLAPSQVYYPSFMSNTTPVVVNGTTSWNNNYMSPDFYSPDFVDNPWMLAEILERPVIVKYPARTYPSSSVLF